MTNEELNAILDWEGEVMKPYIIFSEGCGLEEGAVLGFASSVREMRRLAWKQSALDFDDYLDLGVRLLRDNANVLPLANQEKLKAGIPHIIDNPAHCEVCGLWGAGLTIEGLCGNCNSHPGARLLALFGHESGCNVSPH